MKQWSIAVVAAAMAIAYGLRRARVTSFFRPRPMRENSDDCLSVGAAAAGCAWRFAPRAGLAWTWRGPAGLAGVACWRSAPAACCVPVATAP